MKRHRWVALGAASMTAAQAKEWAGLTGTGVTDTPLDVAFSTIVCLICGESYESALPECLGSLGEESETTHLWQALLTVPCTDEEAAAWADPDGEFNCERPQAIATLCVLCGQTADSADESCPERALWVSGTAIVNQVDPEGIPDGTLVSGKPFGYDQRNDDYADWDVPDYDAAGIGPLVEGPLEKRRSSLGHVVFVVEGISVEPDSIQLVSPPASEDDPRA